MRHLLAITVLSLSCLLMISCTDIVGNGEIIAESRDLNGFKAIDVNIPADIYFTVSDQYQFQIDGESNIVPEIESYVKNDMLIIEFKDKINFGYKPQEKLKVTISAPQLSKITASGVTNFYINSEIREGTFSCKASGAATIQSLSPILIDKGYFSTSGAGSIKLDGVTTNEIKLKSSGASNIDIMMLTANSSKIEQSGASTIDMKSGNTNELSLDLSGSAVFKTLLFLSKKAYIDVSGASSATVCVADELKANASGAASVMFIGSPNTQIKTSGAATVKNKPLFEEAFLKNSQ